MICTNAEISSKEGCLPNPILIPNPYALDIMPAPNPKPAPDPHPSPAEDSNLDKYIAYGAVVAVLMIVLISAFAYKKCIRKDTRNDDALISEAQSEREIKEAK